MLRIELSALLHIYMYLCNLHAGEDTKHFQHPGCLPQGQTPCLCSPSFLGRHCCIFLGPHQFARQGAPIHISRQRM